jgi:hypothetical protein
MDLCRASSAISFRKDSSSAPRLTSWPYASNALSVLTSTRTMSLENCWRRLLKRGTLARGLSPKLSGPSFSCSTEQDFGWGKHCGCALATSIYNTECFPSGTRSSSSRGCSPSEQAWPPRLPATLNNVNLLSRRMNILPASLRLGPGRRFGFGRSRLDSCVCGSEPGFDDLPQTAGNLGFMISARPLALRYRPERKPEM